MRVHGRPATGSARRRTISHPAGHSSFPVSSPNALFFCQQAAEKSLKSFLTWHEQAFRRTHDIEEIGEACCAVDGTLAALVEEADVLSDYAWKLRYPGAPYTPNGEEVESMLSLAVRVFEAVKSRLPPELGLEL